MPDFSIVVMKFGGTSVATPEGRGAIASRVGEAVHQGVSPVLVVSAMGRAGAPYATDTLLGLIADMPSNPRESDLLASAGELISATVIAGELRRAGVSAEAFSGADAGIVTDGAFQHAAITRIVTDRLVAAIESGVVPVVAGFQGVSEDGSVTTLGRGGSDTTACALGVALHAERVDIYSDVDGVMTADPRTCESAVVLESIRSDELFQMAYNGSRIVHTPAADLAVSSGLPVRVCNTYSDHPGTLVSDIASYHPTAVATSISQLDGVVRIRVALPALEDTAEHMAAQATVYQAMADAGVSLDMFTPLGEMLVFSIASRDLDVATGVLDRLALTHVVRPGLSKVTLVGAGMHGVPGVMARVARVLADADVTILQTADSHATISVLVASDEAKTAVRALHDGFTLG